MHRLRRTIDTELGGKLNETDKGGSISVLPAVCLVVVVSICVVFALKGNNVYSFNTRRKKALSEEEEEADPLWHPL